jgi:hypothetical protein
LTTFFAEELSKTKKYSFTFEYFLTHKKTLGGIVRVWHTKQYFSQFWASHLQETVQDIFWSCSYQFVANFYWFSVNYCNF